MAKNIIKYVCRSTTDVSTSLALLHRYGWLRTVLLYDTPAYLGDVGGSGGHLLASTIHTYMLSEGINVFGKELISTQPHEEMLVQDVGNEYASESCLQCNGGVRDVTNETNCEYE